MSRVRLFKQGRRPRVKNLMHGRIEDLAIFIFDYAYTTGSGKNSNTWNQTVTAIQLTGDRLAEFELRPENLFHKIGSAMGYQDIDLEGHPEFSKKYLLRGSDETAICAAFNDDIVEYLTASKGISAESSGDWLVVYRSRKRVSPDAVSDFLEEAFTVCNRMSYLTSST